MQNFRKLGALTPDPRASGGWGLCPQTPRLDAPPLPNTAPQLRISGYAPAQYSSAVSPQKVCRFDITSSKMSSGMQFYHIVSYGMLNEHLNKIDFWQ